MKLTEEQVIYCREHYVPGDKEFGLKPLAEKFGVSRDNIKDCVHGKTYKRFGGKIHQARERVSESLKQTILSDAGTVEELAERYQLRVETIERIIQSQRKRRAVITGELRAAILAEYIPYDPQHNRAALAKKFGLSPSAVGVILKEVARRKVKRIEVLDELKEAIVVAHDEEHLSIRALSERFNINRPLVKEILLEAGIDLPKRQRVLISNEVKQQARALYATGNHSVRELSERFNVNRPALSKVLADITPPKPKGPALDQKIIERVLSFYGRGHGVAPIAKAVGLPATTVRHIVNGEPL